MTPHRTLLSWSSGKDSAWALHVLRQDPTVEVVGLFSTLNEVADRVAMHAVRRTLLERQAEALGLPLTILGIPQPCSHEDYAERMAAFVKAARADGITHMAFGDLFLQDVRRYREERLAGTGITPLFPLWGSDTHTLPQQLFDAGLKARLTCINPRQMPSELAGHAYDAELLAALPAEVDPCGENGEFHSFAWDGPMFRHPVAFSVGDTVERDGYLFTDLLPE